MLGPTLPEHPDVARSEELIEGPDGGTLRIRMYRRRTSDGVSSPGVLWVHGGGFTTGYPEMDDSYCDGFAARFGCVVCSVDYPLAPEHPYPAGLRDCYTALRWFVDHAADLDVDPQRIGLAGQSAGSCLAVGTALLTRDGQGPDVAFVANIYAMLDDRFATPSSVSMHEPRLWNTTVSRSAWRAYLRDVEGNVPPYAAPARATDLTGLPPMFLLVGELDPFCDENVEFARKLRAAGVPAEFHLYPGAYHSFDRFAPEAAVSRSAIAALHAAMERFLHPADPQSPR